MTAGGAAVGGRPCWPAARQPPTAAAGAGYAAPAYRLAPGPPPALLLVAHGSRDPRHAATVRALARRIRALRPGTPVAAGYLDHCAPSVPRAVCRLACAGVPEVVAVPLLLSRAFHAKADIPAALGAVRARHPGVAVRQAAVLGPSPLLTAALERRLGEAGLHRADRAGTGVVLASAGSSDPEAIAVMAAIAREWRRTGWCAVRPAFASACRPRTEDAVRALRAEGVRRVAVAPYVLAPGFLPDRIAAGARGADLLAAVLGPAPEVARLALRRYDEARAAARPAALSA